MRNAFSCKGVKKIKLLGIKNCQAVHTVTRVGVFLVAGLPAFILAIPLNWVMVDVLNWYEPVAYALVLVVQVVINFFMCRWFVFKNKKEMSVVVQFVQFFGGIVFFRALDWGVYTVLVTQFGFYYLAVQLANVFIFSLLKFSFSKRIMERTS